MTLILPRVATAAESLSIALASSLPSYTSSALATSDATNYLYWVYALGDYNEDGRKDFAIFGSAYPSVPGAQRFIRVYLQQTNGTFSAIASNAIPYTEHSRRMLAADLNNDGHLDLIENDEEASANDLLMLVGHGDGTFRHLATWVWRPACFQQRWMSTSMVIST